MFVCETSTCGEHLNKTAILRPDIDPTWTPSGFAPGERVHVRYWKHQYDATSGFYRALYLIGKTADLDRHIAEGEFSCVFNVALQDFERE